MPIINNPNASRPVEAQARQANAATVNVRQQSSMDARAADPLTREPIIDANESERQARLRRLSDEASNDRFQQSQDTLRLSKQRSNSDVIIQPLGHDDSTCQQARSRG